MFSSSKRPPKNASGKKNRGAISFSIIILLNIAIIPAVFLDSWSGHFRPGLPFAITVLVYEICAIEISRAIYSNRINISYFMALVYFTIFLLYPSIFHNKINSFPIYKMSYSKDVLLRTSLILILFISCLSISYNAFRARKVCNEPVEAEGTYRIDMKVGVFLLALSYIVFSLALQRYDISDLLISRQSVYRVVKQSDMTELGIFYTFPKLVSFISITFSVVCFKYEKMRSGNILLFLMNVPVFFILNFPPALPRFFIFGYIIFWIFLLIDIRKSSVKSFVLTSFIVGACLVMPVVDALTRYGRGLGEIDISAALERYISGGDFDGFQSINNAVIYGQNYGPEFGRQIVSALFFFIPRSVWTGKSESTGIITAKAAGYDFLNVSSPLPAELFVDFGYAGVVIGAVVLGYFLSRIDAGLDRSWYRSPKARCIAAAIAGYSIIFYRGALLAVGPVLVIISLGVWAIVVFGIRQRRVQFRSRRGEVLR